MQSNNKNSYATSLFLVGCLFFIFGFITWLNGSLIPFLKLACELTNSQSYLVATAFFASYFVMALPSSMILRKTGFKKGMSLGLVIMAIGAAIFIPAAMQRSYAFFLFGLFTQGLGLTILQTATNPYVTILGPEESAAQRISIMGIANKVAGAIGSILMAGLLLKGILGVQEQLETTANAATRADLLNELMQRIITPYVAIAISLTVLAVLILLSPLPEVNDTEENPDTDSSAHASIWHHKYLFLGVLGIFFYVGAEVISGDSIIAYGTSMGISGEEAKFFTSFTLGGMLAGYVLGIILTPKFMSQETMLKICAALGIALSVCVMLTSGRLSIYCLASLGIANAIMWPAIWPMSLKGLGKFTKTGSALLIMGIIGGAVIPPLFGWLIDMMGSQSSAYIILIPCYLYILYFAVSGHKVGYKEK
ncbi:MAG: sugar MFS transporter [Chitinophagales bacterium]|nr:sugar MFS transporter [Chitinophagales bacterium]